MLFITAQVCRVVMKVVRLRIITTSLFVMLMLFLHTLNIVVAVRVYFRLTTHNVCVMVVIIF